MKKSRPTYLLLLIFLLLQAYHYAFTRAESALQVQSSADVIRLNKLQLDKHHQEETAGDFLLYSEREDDDDDTISHRKKIVTSRICSLLNNISNPESLSQPVASRQLHDQYADKPSYKYILQRTLRV